MSSRPSTAKQRPAAPAAKKLAAKLDAAGLPNSPIPPHFEPPANSDNPDVCRGPWPDPKASPDQLARELADWLKANGFIPENFVLGFIQRIEEGRQDDQPVAIPEGLRLQRKNGVILYGRLRMPDQRPCPEDDFDSKGANRRNNLRALEMLGEGLLTKIVSAERDQDSGEWIVDFDISPDMKPDAARNWTLKAWFRYSDLQAKPKACEAWNRWRHGKMEVDVEAWWHERHSAPGWAEIVRSEDPTISLATIRIEDLRELAKAMMPDAFHPPALATCEGFQGGVRKLKTLSDNLAGRILGSLRRELSKEEIKRRRAERDPEVVSDILVLAALARALKLGDSVERTESNESADTTDDAQRVLLWTRSLSTCRPDIGSNPSEDISIVVSELCDELRCPSPYFISEIDPSRYQSLLEELWPELWAQSNWRPKFIRLWMALNEIKAGEILAEIGSEREEALNRLMTFRDAVNEMLEQEHSQSQADALTRELLQEYQAMRKGNRSLGAQEDEDPHAQLSPDALVSLERIAEKSAATLKAQDKGNQRYWPDLTLKIADDGTIDVLEKGVASRRLTQDALKLTQSEFETLCGLAICGGDFDRGRMTEKARSRVTRLRARLRVYFADYTGDPLPKGRAAFKVERLRRELVRLCAEQEDDDIGQILPDPAALKLLSSNPRKPGRGQRVEIEEFDETL